MNIKEEVMKELVKNGYAKDKGAKVWDIAKRSLWYINENMAKAFLEARKHPRYKMLIETETKLLKENIRDFIKPLKSSKFNLIDMNCIDGSKVSSIISALPKTTKLRYCPASTNEFLIKLALENVKKENFSNIVDYAPRLNPDCNSLNEIGAALRNSTYQKNVLLFLESAISSFEINDYLFKLSQAMLPGDILIIGNGIRSGPRFTQLETYKHPLFHKWFFHLMKEIGFNENELKVDVNFDNKRLEGYYVLNKDKKITHEEKTIEMKKGDKILVAFQYKLYDNELKDFCKMYFDSVKLVKDKEEEYAIVMCKK